MHLGLKAGVTIEVVVFGDAPAMREDLVAFGVFLCRDVTQLLEQRHVHVRLDVTRDTRVPVPVPRAAHVGGLVDEPEALHTQVAQPRPDEQSPEAGADDRDVDIVGQRVARETGVAPGVVREASKRPCDFDVLGDAVGAQPPVPFKRVFRTQGIYVECHRRRLHPAPAKAFPASWPSSRNLARTAITRLNR